MLMSAEAWERTEPGLQHFSFTDQKMKTFKFQVNVQK